MKEFIAIDGEGITVDGHHKYWILCASSGESIEADELASIDVFEWLFSLKRAHPGAIFVIYGGNYDVNKWLYDLRDNIPALRELKEDGVCDWHDYRIRWHPGKSFSVHKEGEIITRRKRNGKIVRGVSWKASFNVWDVFGFFQSSFVKTLEAWKIGDKEVVQAIARMKEERGNFSAANKDAVRAYSFDECRLLVRVMEKLASACEALGVKMGRWDGAGAIAAGLMKLHKVDQYLAVPPRAVYEAALCAYFGGRFETAVVGWLPRGFAYDINSAYPAQAVDLPCLAHGGWSVAPDFEKLALSSREETTDPSLTTRLSRSGLYQVRWRITGQWPRWGPFPHRNKAGRITYPIAGTGWYWGAEVMAAAQMFPEDIEILGGYEWSPSCDHQPFSWIPEIYEQRKRWKAEGNFAEKAAKLGLNSVYGKMAQSVGFRGKRPRFQSFVWAGIVTAGCRSQLLQLISHQPKNVLALATDGVIVQDSLPELATGNKLGTWELNAFTNLLVAQNGVYRYRARGKTYRRNRGFSAREVAWHALHQAYRQDRTYGTVPSQATRFHGLAKSLSKHVPLDNWGEWITETKVLSLRPSNRILCSDLPHLETSPANDYELTVAWQAQSEPSFPYIPKQTWDDAWYDVEDWGLSAG